MESFVWNKYYVTGLSEVDEQHQGLVKVVNEFGELLAKDIVTLADISKIFNDLFEYTTFHFDEEEKLMKNVGMDERHINSHIKLHHHFLDEITRMQKSISIDNIDTAKEIQSFLVHWLAYHILGEDQSMARQINDIESGTSAIEAYNKENTHEGNNAREVLIIALENLFNQVSNRNKELLQLNLSLEDIVQARTKELSEANKQKDELLLKQSKMASMGEMIGNIAHQWRQPIAIISMWANNIIADIDMEEIENENLRKYANNINEQTQYLSQTIDDFRNFYIPNKDANSFTLRSSVDKTMSLLAGSFKAHNIEVMENIEDIEIIALENELTQSLLNIIKNAKDVLVNTPLENRRRLLFIDIYKEDNSVVIEIKDSGGGIEEDILNKVYEPYFTTKQKTEGTGIGLYMTESIVTKHLNGEIIVLNEEYEYDEEKYKGAKFRIKLFDCF